MRVYVNLKNNKVEYHRNVEATGIEGCYYWVRERTAGKRTVTKYMLWEIVAVEEKYED
jgi:hypothetical protein